MSRRTIAYLATGLILMTGTSLSLLPMARHALADSHAANAGDEALALPDLMKELGGSQRKLRRMIKDPASVTESLRIVRRMQKLTAAGMMGSPEKTSDLQVSERSAFLLAYKRQIVQLIGRLLDLEEALLQGDTKIGQEIFRDLGKIKSEGHRRFQRPEE